MKKYTQEEVDARTSDNCCFDCGVQFLTESQKEYREKNTLAVTAFEADCCLCGEKKGVTDIRHWNRLRIQEQTLN